MTIYTIMSIILTCMLIQFILDDFWICESVLIYFFTYFWRDYVRYDVLMKTSASLLAIYCIYIYKAKYTKSMIFFTMYDNFKKSSNYYLLIVTHDIYMERCKTSWSIDLVNLHKHIHIPAYLLSAFLGEWEKIRHLNL